MPEQFAFTQFGEPRAAEARGLAEGAAARRLLQAFDLLLAMILGGIPLLLGGRHPVAELAYVALVGLLAATWLARQALLEQPRWRWCGAEGLLAAAMLLVLLQLLPLPGWHALAPGRAELLPLWQGDSHPGSLGAWSSISLNPSATFGGGVLLAAHGALFLLVLQRVDKPAEIRRVLAWVGGAAVLLAVLSLAQLGLGNGKFLWVYHHPYRDTFGPARGPFSNENHLAHFLALGLGPLLALAAAGSRGEDSRGGLLGALLRRWPAVGAALVVTAGLLTFSRGGVLMLLLAGGLTATLLALRGGLGRRVLLPLAGAGLAAGAVLAFHGLEPLARQLGTLSSGSWEQIDSGDRLALWRADWQALAAYGPLGTGVGTHAEIYPTFLEKQSPVEFTHAESGYVQVLLETGWPGALLLAAACGVAVWWSLRGLRLRRAPGEYRAAAALAAAMAVSLTHALFDFAWYLPGCLAPTLALAACAARLARPDSPAGPADEFSAAPRRPSAPRFLWAGGAALALCCTAILAHDRLGPARGALPWEEYLSLSLAADETAPADWRRRGRRATFGQVDDAQPAVLARMRSLLAEAAARDPRQARYHLRLGQLTLRQFELQQLASENAMSLADVRDAALASRFPSREEQEAWLTRALGENRPLLDTARGHLLRAVHLCPAQGEAYALLAQLAFLDGRRETARDALLEQALRLRPHAGEVQLTAGREAARRGDAEAALRHLRIAFTRGPRAQRQIVDFLAPTMPAEVFLAAFQPDSAGLRLLWERYRHLGAERQAAVAGRAHAERLIAEAEPLHGAEAARRWNRAMHVLHTLADHPAALHCARRAVACAPEEYEYRAALAQRLTLSGEREEAAAEWRWCLRRRPEDPRAREQLAALATPPLTR